MSHKIGVIIPTCSPERKELLAFVEKRMAGQTLQADYIFKIDYPNQTDKPDLVKRYKDGFQKCKEAGCDFVLLVEDDDYYPLTYIQDMYDEWIKNDKPLIIGNKKTTYYHIQSRKYLVLKTEIHSSAHCTGLSIDAKVDVIEGNSSVFYDIKLWQENKGVLIDLKNPVISIKHGLGRIGGNGHTAKGFTYRLTDNDWSVLRGLVDTQGFLFYVNFRKHLFSMDKCRYNVTVLMNCYKENKRTFTNAINSIYNNKGVDINLVIATVEGDKCIKWCEDYPIKVVVNKEAHIFKQFNSMLPYITGDFVTYASANDVMYSDKLYSECKYLERTAKGICYSDFHVINIEGKQSTFISPAYSYDKNLEGSFITDCAMFRTDIFKTYMPLEIKWGNNAIWDMFLRIYEGSGNVFTHLNKVTWKYIKTADSGSEKRKLNPEKYKANEELKSKLKIHHLKIKDSRIQLRCSGSISFFKTPLQDKYKFIEYQNEHSYTIFFGMYTTLDYEALKNHKGNAKILWGGTDALKLPEFIKKYKDVLKKYTHIAQSSFIYHTLAAHKIHSELIPITTVNVEDIKPEPIGNSIYFYVGNNTNFYGAHYIDKIRKGTGLEVIVTKSKEFKRGEVLEMYKKCFIGLRLTPHDGLPHTVVEMGLMGRPCIFNGKGIPGTIEWNNIADIINTILKVHKERKEIDVEEMHNSFINYLKGDEKWLDI